MRVYKGKVVSDDDKDLEYKSLVEEYITTSTTVRTATRQYVNSLIDIMQLKERINVSKEGNILYFISLRKIFDNMELRNAIKSIVENKDSVEKGSSYLYRQIDEYEKLLELEEEQDKIDVFGNMFITYAKSYAEVIDKQGGLATQYWIRVKKVEKPSDSDRNYLADLEAKIAKNDARMKMIESELMDTWVKVPKEIQEQIMDAEVTTDEIK